MGGAISNSQQRFSFWCNCCGYFMWIYFYACILIAQGEQILSSRVLQEQLQKSSQRPQQESLLNCDPPWKLQTASTVQPHTPFRGLRVSSTDATTSLPQCDCCCTVFSPPVPPTVQWSQASGGSILAPFHKGSGAGCFGTKFPLWLAQQLTTLGYWFWEQFSAVPPLQTFFTANVTRLLHCRRGHNSSAALSFAQRDAGPKHIDEHRLSII